MATTKKSPIVAIVAIFSIVLISIIAIYSTGHNTTTKKMSNKDWRQEYIKAKDELFKNDMAGAKARGECAVEKAELNRKHAVREIANLQDLALCRKQLDLIHNKKTYGQQHCN